MSKNYCGYISIIGKPNVGKSSIINKILEKKVSITSRKSQTTRNNILGVKTDRNKQMIFIDTPGMHIKSQRTMNKILNKSAQSIVEDSDLVLFVVQRLTIDAEDKSIISKLSDTNSLKICVINKIDQIKNKNELLPFIEQLTTEYGFDSIIPISAETGQNLDELINLIKKNLPENDHIYDEELSISDNRNRFMISELIREKIIRKLGDELPHDTYVDIEDIKEKKGITHINATIFVNRQSQKQIVIGSGGKNLKIIGEQARADIEEFLKTKVFLKTWVKVKKNWNTDTSFIHSLGVGTNYESD
ncbi:MAG: GTPase Era [Flavobacterium sp. SCGC AAA160-P02]|nr:MAG: GTPase Era [Flavobacterium sp. SCGC AAA160-P02]